MRRVGAELAAGATVLGVCVVVLALVPLVADPEAFAVPRWAWVTGAGAYVALTVWLVPRPRGSRSAAVGLAVHTLLTGLLVVGVPGAGWVPILLVFGAATSTYLVPWRGTALVVAANTVALTIGTLLARDAVGRTDGLVEVAFGVGVYLLLQVASAFVCVALQREQRQRVELAVAHAELAAAAVLRDETTRASERLHIARELHDLLGHQLTVLALELEAAVHRPDPDRSEHVGRARDVARELLGDVRATVGELRRRAPDLREALGAVAGAVPHPRVEVRVADDVVADEEQTVALVRVVQEAVTNTVRHADEASSLDVEVTVREGWLRLVAQDDGYGPGAVRPGHGLRGITERVEQAGGDVRFDGTRGFRIEVGLPVRWAS